VKMGATQPCLVVSIDFIASEILLDFLCSWYA